MEYVVWTSEFNIAGKDVNGDEINYTVTPRFLPAGCPRCGSDALINYGSYSRRFRDIPQGSYSVFINVRANRWQCRSCGCTFVPQYKSVSEKSRVTNQLRQRIRDQFSRERVDEIAAQYSMSFSTVYRITKEVAEELKPYPYLPECLGIAELKICGRTRLVLLDMENETVIDILSSAFAEKLVDHLKSKEGGNVRYLFCGFRKSHVKAVGSLFSPAVCLDMYYVFSGLGTAVKEDSKAHLEHLPEIFAAESALSELYSSYRPLRPGEIEESIDEILEDLPPDCGALKSYLAKLVTCSAEIAAFISNRNIDHEYMTYITDRIKRIEKANAGCSFETIRLKVLLSNSA